MGTKSLAIAVVLLLAVGPLLQEGRTGINNSTVPKGDDVGRSPTLDDRTPAIKEMFTGIGDSFIENQGQLKDSAIRFYTQGGSVSVGLTNSEIIVVMGKVPSSAIGFPTSGIEDIDGAITHFSIRFEGCNPVRPVGRESNPEVVNYLIGNDPTKWVRGVGSFREVVYEGLYEGVDLVLRLNGGVLKYDMMLSAGADAGLIAFRYENVQGLSLDGTTGDLIIQTEAGELRDGRPIIFQEGTLPAEGASGRFRLDGEDRVGYELPSACSPERPLLIDPGLVFQTYLGGKADGPACCVDVDKMGDIIVSGYTQSIDFPVTNGTYDPKGNVSLDADVFISRLNESGHVRCSTFFGGTRADGARDLMVAPDGSIMIVGETNSTDLYVTDDAIQKTNRGNFDGILFEISSDLSQILYSTYFGGSLEDDLLNIDLDKEGCACISGMTNSSNIQTTLGAYCTTYVKTDKYEDSILVCRLSNTLSQLLYCSYFNVWNSSKDPYSVPADTPTVAISQAMDDQGRLYIAGKTNLTTFPASSGAYQKKYRGGVTDGFIALFQFEGAGQSDLVAATYFGGNGREDIAGILVLDSGNVCVNVGTYSTNLEVSQNAPYKNLPMNDAFLAILSWNLSDLVFGTYFGGSDMDFSYGLAKANGNDTVYMFGITFSADLNLTPGCFDNRLRGAGWGTHYIVAFNTSEMKFGYCTMMGYELGLNDNNNFCIVDRDGMLVIAGQTVITDLPTTKGAFQLHNKGLIDAYVLKLDPTPCGLPDPPSNLTATPADGRVTLEWEPQTMIGYRVLYYRIYKGDSPGTLSPVETIDGSQNTKSYSGLENGKVYYYGVAAVNSAGEGEKSIVQARPNRPPSQPQSLLLTTGDGTVNLSWASPAETGGGLLGYHILRGPTLVAFNPLITTDANASSYRDWNVTKGSMYYYVVIAFNDAGNGTMTFKSITPRSPPSPPTDLALNANDSMIRVTWLPPGDDGGGVITGYMVHIRDPLTNVTKAIGVTKNTLSYEDRTVQNGRTYFYYVTALAVPYESGPTPTRSERPFGKPSAPRELHATPGDRQISLDWSPPESDNGRPITGYIIYWGSSPGKLDNIIEIGNQTSYLVLRPENGVTYFFQVAAINEAGQGLPCAEASGTPLGPPGKVTPLGYELQDGSVLLKWSFPTDKGGASSVRYVVSRRMLDSTFVQLGEVVDVGEFKDATAEVGNTYVYRVVAANTLFEGLPEEVSVFVMKAPAAVTNLTVYPGDGLIELRWSPPQSDGGSNITAYFIWKRAADGKSAQLNWTLLLNYVDREVVPGGNYWYYIIARNAMGNGPIGRQQNATVLTHPGPVSDLQVLYRDGAVELSWLPPTKQWGASPTGYSVLRGTTTSDLIVIAELGLNQTYHDDTVEKGNIYYYRVIATSALGQGDPSDVQEVRVGTAKTVSLTPWVALVLIIVVVVLGAVAVVYMRRRGAAAAGVPTVHIVEEVLVVLGDGRLIGASWREESRSQDADLMSGMLVAIQGIAREGLERGGMLRSINYEDNTILMAGGQMLYMAAVVYGNPDPALVEALEATVTQIEATYAPTIETWNGDTSVFEGIEDMLRPLIDRTKDVTREDVQRAGAAPREVELTH